MLENFGVSFQFPDNPRVVVLGVTSITSQNGGFLLTTEDGENFQIEKCDLEDGTYVPDVRFDLYDDGILADLADYYVGASTADELVIHDHRTEKWVEFTERRYTND